MKNFVRSFLWPASLAVATAMIAPPVVAQSKPSAPSRVCIQDSTGPSSCSNTSTSKKWNPGHYLAANAFGFPKDDWGRFRVYDMVKSNTAFKGGLVRMPWGALEPRQGEYNFTQIDKDLAHLKAMGKQLIIEVWWEGYSQERVGQSGDRYFPDYILAREGAVIQVGGYWTVNLDDPYLMDRFVALCKALAARYNNDPNVEQFAINETAHERGYEWKRAIPQIASAWPNTPVVLYVNWIDTPELSRDLMAIMGTHGVGMGGPDILPPEPMGKYGEDFGSRSLRGAGHGPVYQDNPGHGSGDFGSTDYRGRVPVAYNFQALHGMAPSRLIDYALNTLRATHLTWSSTEDAWLPSDQKMSSDLYFSTGILPTVVGSGGKTTATCPSAFNGQCVTK